MKVARTFIQEYAPPIPLGYRRAFVRCSPDCPYDDCIISVIDMPIEAEGGGDGEPDSDKSDSKPVDSEPSGGAGDGKEGQPEEGETKQKDSKGDGKSDEKPGSEPGKAGKAPEPKSDGSPKPAEHPKPGPSPETKPGPSPGTAADTPGPSPPSGPESVPAPRPEPREVEYTPDPGYGSSDTDIKNPPVPEKYRYLADRVFQSKLRNVMLDNSFDRPVRGRKRGKLDMRSLYKVPSKAENIFTLKEARKNKKYNILLLVDESGSMLSSRRGVDGGYKHKAQIAAEAAVFLAQSFEGLNLDLAIVGFNKYITVRKEFGHPTDYDKIYEAISTANHGKGSGDNNDWDALNKAYTMFKPGVKGENILIMLSDGQPASTDYPKFINIKGNEETAPAGTDRLHKGEKNQIDHLHHLVKANDRKVKSIGIGIFEGGGQIPTHEIVSNLEELKPAIIKQLAGRIKRG